LTPQSAASGTLRDRVPRESDHLAGSSGDSEGGVLAAGLYVRRARLAPVALVVAPLLPLAGTAIAVLPGWLKVASGIWLVAAYAVQELGRDRGLQLEPALWSSWGGPPTTDALRWRTSANLTLTKERHRQVQAIVGHHLRLPTERRECSNPELADNIYEAAVSALRNATRVGERRLLQENAGYGFRRNCLGLRSWGIAAAALVLVVSLLTIPALASVDSLAVAVFCGTVGGTFAAFWLWVVTPAWVHRQAVAYSRELFAVVERRSRDRPSSSEGQDDEQSEEDGDGT
jgi:hypothetical protein